ncbi:MAG TPA: sugar phosphate nucleotidyltransferase [Acidimicrobiales bacterium]|nr:sugar phosphate nucleotidyltransferase [Acidimicrobiales bacterium]
MADGTTTPTIILCGGRGTRMSEYTTTLPKPLVPIGERPVLWHIMKIYAAHGFTDFVLALGWLGEAIKEFVLHFEALTRDFTVEVGRPDSMTFLGDHPEQGWRITCLDTGVESLTGTRVRRAAAAIAGDTIGVTYGDGVADVDLAAVMAFHRAHGKLATITAVRPPGRFGELRIADGVVKAFEEKPQTSGGAIGGGFMLFEREAIERYIPTDQDVMLEREPLSSMARDGELIAYEHSGFFQPMDTPREQTLLTELWESGKAPWKVWS